MTNKENFEKNFEAPSKNNKYRLGRTKIERQQIFEYIKEMIENGFSLQNIADKYGVTKQAISLKMINGGFNVSQEVKRIKREKIKKLLEETSVNNVEKLNRKVIYYSTYNSRLRNDLTELKEKLLRKEQECEELKEQLTILDDENVVVEITVKQFEEYKKLKAGIDELKKQTCGFRPELKHIIDKTCCKYNINAKYYHEKIVEIINNLDKYKQTLTDIIKIAEKYKNLNFGEQQYCYSEILQKISEVENDLEN